MKVELINYSNLFGPPKNDNPFLSNLLVLMKDYWQEDRDNSLENIYQYIQTHQYSNLMNMLTLTFRITDSRSVTSLFAHYPGFYSFELALPYSQDTEVNKNTLNFISQDIRFNDKKTTQESIQLDPNERDRFLLNVDWKELQYNIVRDSFNTYKTALEKDISLKEAISVLPIGLIESQLYVQGTLKEWANFIRLIRGSQLSYDERKLVEECYRIIKEIAPFIVFIS
jgi:thymidylate synthase ThyX